MTQHADASVLFAPMTDVSDNRDVAEMLALLRESTRGEYDVVGELGRGGMAAVYLAIDLSLNRKVAVKTILPGVVHKPGVVERFRREAQTAASLSHPNIIPIYSVKQAPHLVYFVMKFIEGSSLESVLRDAGRLELGAVRAILFQVSSALSFAHATAWCIVISSLPTSCWTSTGGRS